MRILALETSGRSGSLALLEGIQSAEPACRDVRGRETRAQLLPKESPSAEPALLREVFLPEDQRTAQCLAPLMKEALDEAGWEPGSLELICVTHGPGSFTGLRIGVTTAKTLAYATGAKLVGVSTLAVLARQARIDAGRVWAVLDAQRGELFAQVYDASADFALAPDETRVLSVEDWLGELRPEDSVTGPILPKLRGRLPSEVQVASETLWHPTARTVGELGWQRFNAGQLDDLWQFVPRYYRRSAAEDKWDSRGATGFASAKKTELNTGRASGTH